MEGKKEDELKKNWKDKLFPFSDENKEMKKDRNPNRTA